MAVLIGVTPDVMSKLMSGIANPAMRPGAVQSLDDPGATGLTHDPLFYAGWLAMLGADDRALTVLERAAVQRTSANPETIWDPVFDPIRNDPRFKAVLKKMGLPYTPASVAKP